METPRKGSKRGANGQVGRSAKFPKFISESEEELLDTDDDEGDGPSGPLSRRLQHPTDDQMDLSQGLEASAFAGKPATTGVTTAEQTKVAKALAKKAKNKAKKERANTKHPKKMKKGVTAASGERASERSRSSNSEAHSHSTRSGPLTGAV